MWCYVARRKARFVEAPTYSPAHENTRDARELFPANGNCHAWCVCAYTCARLRKHEKFRRMRAALSEIDAVPRSRAIARMLELQPAARLSSSNDLSRWEITRADSRAARIILRRIVRLFTIARTYSRMQTSSPSPCVNSRNFGAALRSMRKSNTW